MEVCPLVHSCAQREPAWHPRAVPAVNVCAYGVGSHSPSWEPDLEHTYMMDVVEEVGFDVSHRCYWDFGRWSDLCRVWRRAGDDLPPEDAVDFEVSAYSTAGCDQTMRTCHALYTASSQHQSHNFLSLAPHCILRLFAAGCSEQDQHV